MEGGGVVELVIYSMSAMMGKDCSQEGWGGKRAKESSRTSLIPVNKVIKMKQLKNLKKTIQCWFCW